MAPDAPSHPALRPYVESVRHYDLVGFAAGVHIGLPSASVTLVLPLDAPLDLAMPGVPRREMITTLAGLHDAPSQIYHSGTMRGLQLALTPLGLHRLTGTPAAAIAGQAVEIADLLGARVAGSLLDQLASAPTWPGRKALVEAALVRRLTDAPARHRGGKPEVERAWSVLAAQGGAVRIAELAADVGWSTRHLTTQFVNTVGATPKTVARIMRFTRSAELVARGQELADVAAHCRYADQPHMTREWNRLAGTTPARWPRVDHVANVQDNRHAPPR